MGGGGGGSSGGGGSAAPAPSYSSPPVGNASDYYSQALSLLQPSADAQTAPLQAQAAGLDAVYAQKKTVLNQGLDTTKALYANTTGSINQQAGTARQDINAASAAAQGQQRASAGDRGFAATSGVEQSAEANIQQGTDRQLTNLAERVTSQLADLGIHEAADEQSINNEIANLPSEEAAQALDYASQIAKIQGQTWTEAFKMGAQMLHQAQTLAMEQQRFDEATKYHQDEIALRTAEVKISQQRADRVGSDSQKLTKDDIIGYAQQDSRSGVTLTKMMQAYSGYLSPDEVMQIYNSNSKYGAAKESQPGNRQGRAQLNAWGVKNY